jgi:ferrous iron transport protein A
MKRFLVSSGERCNETNTGQHMQLSELSIGQKAKITALNGGDKAYRQRLVAMGLIPGTELTLTRMAPFGDPVEIQIRGTRLTLRKHEACLLQLEALV